MFKLTRKADYGMIAMLYHADYEKGTQPSARDIAEYYGISLAVVAKSLQVPAGANLVAAQHGSYGGYSHTHSGQNQRLRCDHGI